MILKFRSSALWDENCDGLPPVVVPEEDWTWVDDIQKVQICDQIDIPLEGDEDDDGTQVTPHVYLKPQDHFADVHWIGVNPRLYKKHNHTNRENLTYTMCYVYRRNGKVDLLAVGFLAEVYLLNDEGKTIDRIVNEPW